MNLPNQPFSFPEHLNPALRMQFCLRVLNQYRRELPQLRRNAAILAKQKEKNQQEAGYWKEKYQKEKQEKEKLKKENNQLKQEIEKLTKTTNRYRASLFDHGNFHFPLKADQKSKGGQTGHPDTNREKQENSRSYSHKRVFASHCSRCGQSLNRVNSVQQKILIDIVLNPQVVKLIIDSERQWCGACKKEVSARDSRSLPFTEFGINTFMMALLLRYRCLLPLAKIAVVLDIGYGLQISESGLASLFSQAKQYLDFRYEELKDIIRKGQIMYNDETGWQVRGKNAWMWIMASGEATVYVAAESRGKGVAQEIYGTSQAFSMHDGLASYTNAIPTEKQLFCWAHMLRFAFEETADKPKNHESVHIRDTLVMVYHFTKDPRYWNNPQKLEQAAAKQIDQLLTSTSHDPTVSAILHRLREQRDGLIRALVVSPNGTNNFAEQELRPIALSRKISFGSDTYTGMETTAVLASVVQTLVRTKREEFFPLLQSYLREGFANS
jgi:transposase